MTGSEMPTTGKPSWSRSASEGSRWLGHLNSSERLKIASMGLVVLGINAAGWGLFVFAVAPHHFRYEKLGVGLGVAFTAWTLGFRHAFDADHISAIDNTTRKLMVDGKRPLGTGFFFALGHSTTIVAVGAGISVGARAVFGAVVEPNSGFETIGGLVGTLLSAGFLYLIAAMNFVILLGILKVFMEMRNGVFNAIQLEKQLQSRGFMYRYFGRFMGSINHSWQMVFVGLVFGVGFDTTTEILLLSATAFAATSGLPFYAVLALPLLFSGGIALMDTLDGWVMNFAYGWALAQPVRKVYYNVVITGLSIAAAFMIGTIEVLAVVTAKLHMHGAFWGYVSDFNINQAGFAIAGLFIVVWAGAIAIWKLGSLEDRWAGPSPET